MKEDIENDEMSAVLTCNGRDASSSSSSGRLVRRRVEDMRVAGVVRRRIAQAWMNR